MQENFDKNKNLNHIMVFKLQQKNKAIDHKSVNVHHCNNEKKFLHNKGVTLFHYSRNWIKIETSKKTQFLRGAKYQLFVTQVCCEILMFRYYTLKHEL